MKGDDKLIAKLNVLLTGELSAADQYFTHASMYEDWGLDKLYERIKHESEEELEHADALIKRILFLEGFPDLSKRDPIHVGKSVPEMLQNDLNLEYEVATALKDVIEYAESIRDYQTREILEVLLKDTEEDHAYWLEKQLGLIDKVGLQNYTQSQMS